MKIKGVTLTELLISLVMLSILLFAAIPLYYAYVVKAQLSTILAESQRFVLQGMNLMARQLSCTPSTTGALTTGVGSLIDSYFIYTPSSVTPPMCIIKFKIKNTSDIDPSLKGKMIQYEFREFLSATYREYCYSNIPNIVNCGYSGISFDNSSGPLS